MLELKLELEPANVAAELLLHPAITPLLNWHGGNSLDQDQPQHRTQAQSDLIRYHPLDYLHPYRIKERVPHAAISPAHAAAYPLHQAACLMFSTDPRFSRLSSRSSCCLSIICLIVVHHRHHCSFAHSLTNERLTLSVVSPAKHFTVLCHCFDSELHGWCRSRSVSLLARTAWSHRRLVLCLQFCSFCIAALNRLNRLHCKLESRA